MKRILIFAATYNEADNIKKLTKGIFANLPQADLLVIDDNSPDGTGKILDEIISKNIQVRVIHRPNKLGLGSAHRLAMKYAVTNKYDLLITMDSDLSHNPEYIPKIIELLDKNDFVTGSRYVKGGRSDYSVYRKIISHTANILARILLGIPLQECTTSFRGFRTELLDNLNIDAIRSDGYSFFFESIFYVTRLTKRYCEFPIYFENRASGISKISKTEIIKSIVNLIRLFVLRWSFDKKRIIKPEGASTTSVSPCINCGSLFASLIYPKTFSKNKGTGSYNCTSMTHGSHGNIVKCLQCGLVRTDPLPDEKGLLDNYSNINETLYADNIGYRFKTFRYNLNKIASYLPKNGTLLDVGANCGAFLKIASEAGYTAQGVEPSGWCTDYARQKLGQKVTKGTVSDLDPSEKEFDVVTMFDVLEHLLNPINDLELVNKRMKKGGMLILSTLDIDSILPKILGGKWPWLMDMHIYYFNSQIIEQILQKTGFKVVYSRGYTHIINLDYLLLKLENMSIWGAGNIGKFLRMVRINRIQLPISFGDIKLFVAKKL
ncbi:MAG: glycosyltransferase [Candidatus Margulisiibacteriota bacterium]